MRKRKYQQKRRAEQSRETRQQIVEAMMELHEKLGPAQTSIKAIAEHAGVQRLTVYRHFPDEVSMFKACTSHWLELNPPPAMADWEQVEEPMQQVARALLAFYRYYRGTERMWQVTYRDLDEVEALQAPIAAFEAYIDTVRDGLVARMKVNAKDKKILSLTLRHVLRFTTWQSLKNESLSDKKIMALVTSWLPV